MKKLVVFLMVVSMMSVLLVACNSKDNSPVNGTNNVESTDQVKAGNDVESTEQVKSESEDKADDNALATAYPLEITIYDEQNNEYKQVFEKAPERVVTNNLSSTELLLQLGLGDKIIGILNPDNKVTGEFATTIEGLKHLGDKNTTAKEVILGEKPDVIVGRSLMFDDQFMGSIQTYNEFGVNVFTQSASIVPQNPSLSAIIDDVLTLGQIFNVNERAKEYAAELQTRYDNILKLVEEKKADTELSVLAMVALNSEDGTFFSFNISSGLQRDLLSALNLVPAIEGINDGSNYETLLSVNPDIILYIKADRNADFDEKALDTLYGESLIQEVSAIKEKRVIEVNYDDFMDYGVRNFDSLETLSQELYQ